MEKKIKTEPIKKKSLYREDVENALRNAILLGELKPGDRVVETKWARSLGISQSPVREAIQNLVAAGLIENVPYQGAFVRKITRKDVKNCYLVRMSLEQIGVKDAVKGLTEEKLQEIHRALLEMEQAAQVHDFDTYIIKDVYFHQLIMEISDNELLLKLWNQCDIREWTWIGTESSEKALTMLATRHEAIYTALKERDEEKASIEVKRHFEELVKELDEQAEE